MKSNIIPSNIILSTFFIAFLCDIKAINSIFTAGAGELADAEGGLLAYLYMFSMIFATFSGLFFSQWNHRSFNKSILFIVIWVIFFYIITYVFIAPPFTNFILLSVYTLISIMLPSFTKVDGRLFLRFAMFFSIPAVSRINDIFVFVDYSDSLSMGQSYAFLFPVIATIVYLFVYFKNDNLWGRIITIILSVINGIFAYYLVSFGSRGPVLAILSTILFLLVFKKPSGVAGIKIRKGRFAIAGTVIVIVLFSLVAVMNFLRDVLGAYNISLFFVDKFLNLGDKGDMTNGRAWLYEIAFSDIGINPILGMGFDQFANNHGDVGLYYPHNFLIQILYDGGVVLLLVLGIPIFKGFKRIWKTCTIDEYAVVVALAFSSIPRALFSGDLWQNGPLWLLFGFVLCKGFVIDHHRISNINNYYKDERLG